MHYLKTTQITVRPVDPILTDLFILIKNNYNINIYNYRVLEIGNGTGNKSIELAKLFVSYYAIESDNELYNKQIEFLKQHNSRIKSFNMGWIGFVTSTEKKFKLIYLENVIHLIDYNQFFNYAKNILYPSSFILIKTPVSKPFGWGYNKFNKSSEHFDATQWQKFKIQLIECYNTLDSLDNLINKITSDFFIYYLFYFE